MAKKKPKYKTILVAVLEESYGEIAHAVMTTTACYGKDVILADTKATGKILKAIAEGKEVVVI